MIRKTTAGLGVAALMTLPVLTAAPAAATDKDFRLGGADVDYSVEKDDGRFEVTVDIDDARPGTRWRIVLWQDGKRYFADTRRADADGDVRDVERNRPDTRGRDVFKVKVKKIGGEAKTRVIRKR